LTNATTSGNGGPSGPPHPEAALRERITNLRDAEWSKWIAAEDGSIDEAYTQGRTDALNIVLRMFGGDDE